MYFYVLSPHHKGFWMSIKPAFFVTRSVWMCLLKATSALHLVFKINRAAMFPPKPLYSSEPRAGSRVSSRHFWSGHRLHFCTSAHRREAKCCERRGQSPRQSEDWTGPWVAAGSGRLSYLGLLEARVLRCRFEPQGDTCSLSPGCLGCSHRGNLE